MFTCSRTYYSGDDEKVGNIKFGIFGERMPNGFVKETGTPYRSGAAYLRYGNTQIGIESDRYIRHPIQDRFAHGLNAQPGFQTLSNGIKPFYHYQSSSPTKRFTLYE